MTEISALQLHEKVQKLIEQYTQDKQRLAELEKALKERDNDNAGFIAQINKLQTDLNEAQFTIEKLTQENISLTKKNQELQTKLNEIDSFTAELNAKLDDLIPQIEKL